MSDKSSDLVKIRGVADFQFGKDVGQHLFPSEVKIFHSKKTKRIRHVYLQEKRLATLRPSNGFFSLTVAGAKRIVENVKAPIAWVKVLGAVEPYIIRGRSVFAKHVVDADKEIRPQEEVIILNQKNEVLAVGRALLTGVEMVAFQIGMAVRVRQGAQKVKMRSLEPAIGGVVNCVEK